jgi:DNA-binding LacI/PurR family transcriptional regulator
MATTMKDVARQAGVDVSTVSLAINNDPRIRRETRERILAIASDLGYRKNHLARGLRSGKSFTIGAVVGYTSSAFWSEVLAGAQSVLAERDYHLLLDYAPSELRQEETQIEALKQKRVDGFLIARATTTRSRPTPNLPSSITALWKKKRSRSCLSTDLYRGWKPIMSPPTTSPPHAPQPAIFCDSDTNASRTCTPRTA